MHFRKKTVVLALALFLGVLFTIQPNLCAKDIKEITVAYFPGWPCTFEVGWAKGWFDQELGIKVKFREFDTGAAMTTAMASGSVQVAYSLGMSPFTSAITQGVPIKMVGIAVSYAEAENIVARNGSGIRSPRDLIGKKVGVPYATNSHFKMMGILESFGIKETELKLIDMAPQDIVAAFRRGDIDAGIAWEPARSNMLENGHLIVSAKDLTRWGYGTFDIVAVTDAFAKEHPQLISRFLKVVDKSTQFAKAHPQEAYKLIGKKAGLGPDKTRDILGTMEFFLAKEQLSQTWMGTPKKKGDMVNKLKGIGQFLVSQKAIDKALNDYTRFVDPSFLETAR